LITKNKKNNKEKERKMKNKQKTGMKQGKERSFATSTTATSTTKLFEITSTPTDFGGFYKITRRGQEDPAYGDNVVVCGKVYLPCRNDADAAAYGYPLNKSLQFVGRVRLAGDYLTGSWGEIEKGSSDTPRKFRFIEKEFSAPKWREAFSIAQQWAEEELNKLSEALKKRAKALADAED